LRSGGTEAGAGLIDGGERHSVRKSRALERESGRTLRRGLHEQLDASSKEEGKSSGDHSRDSYRAWGSVWRKTCAGKSQRLDSRKVGMQCRKLYALCGKGGEKRRKKKMDETGTKIDKDQAGRLVWKGSEIHRNPAYQLN